MQLHKQSSTGGGRSLSDPLDSLHDINYPEAQDFLNAFAQPITREEFFRNGPMQPQIASGWLGSFWDRDMIYDEHPTYRYPQVRPTAEDVLADLKELAGTDGPAVNYPDDFFSRNVIYGS